MCYYRLPQNMNITEINLNPEIISALADMGYEELTPVQEKVLPLLLDGKDVVAEAPTGTGKTACYSLPLLNSLVMDSFIHGLIICPTRELAIQVCKEITKFSKNMKRVKTVSIYGGQKASTQINALTKRPSIVVGTPGRILDLVERRKLDLSHVSYLVLDECDEMLDMGFIRDIDKVVANVKGPHQTSLFSATISTEIKKVSKKYLSPDFLEVKVERDLLHQAQIEQKYVKVSEVKKKEAVVSLLNSLSFSRAFVFCRTKHKVMQIEKVLKSNTSHSVTSLQGNLSQNKRDKAMNDFRNYVCDVMVATDIAARGIDVSDVDVVINLDVPEQDEFYLHRIGRTGRVEAKGTSYTFLTKGQLPLIKKYESMSKHTLSEYVLSEEGNQIIMNKYLESLAPLLGESKDKALEDIKEACDVFSKKEGRTVLPIEIAAMMLIQLSKEPVDRPIRSERHEESIERNKERKPRLSGSRGAEQRFFISLGAMDRLDEDGLAEFIEQCAPSLDRSDFVDIYVKDSFSFFTIKKDKADEVLAGLQNKKLNGRDVHSEFADRRDSSERSGFAPRRNGYSSRSRTDSDYSAPKRSYSSHSRTDSDYSAPKRGYSSRGSSQRGGYPKRSSSGRGYKKD